MQALRNASILVRLVLAWFVVALGAAVAAPAAQPAGAAQWICAGGVLKLVPSDDPDVSPQLQAGLDCPLCAPAGAPPAHAGWDGLRVPPVAAAPLQASQVPAPAPLAGPLPARGPPLLLPA